MKEPFCASYAASTDTDGDGLGDGAVNRRHTDPRNADTDTDGWLTS